MTILDFTLWLQSTDLFSALRYSAYAYPTVLTLHMVGIGLFGGTILATDLRLLGKIMTNRPALEVINQLRPLKIAGILLTATCGILMFGSKAEEYYYNIFFKLKLLTFLLVILHSAIFWKSVYHNPDLDRGPQLPGTARLAGALSLLLWTCVAICGRGIGYIDAPLNIHANAAPQQPGLGTLKYGTHDPARLDPR